MQTNTGSGAAAANVVLPTPATPWTRMRGGGSAVVDSGERARWPSGSLLPGRLDPVGWLAGLDGAGGFEQLADGRRPRRVRGLGNLQLGADVLGGIVTPVCRLLDR